MERKCHGLSECSVEGSVRASYGDGSDDDLEEKGCTSCMREIVCVSSDQLEFEILKFKVNWPDP